MQALEKKFDRQKSINVNLINQVELLDVQLKKQKQMLGQKIQVTDKKTVECNNLVEKLRESENMINSLQTQIVEMSTTEVAKDNGPDPEDVTFRETSNNLHVKQCQKDAIHKPNDPPGKENNCDKSIDKLPEIPMLGDVELLIHLEKRTTVTNL